MGEFLTSHSSDLSLGDSPEKSCSSSNVPWLKKKFHNAVAYLLMTASTLLSARGNGAEAQNLVDSVIPRT